MANKDDQKFHEFLAKTVVGPADDSAGEVGLAWPHEGQIFDEVFVIKLPTDDEPWFLTETLHQEVYNVLSSWGSHNMEEPIFAKEDIIKEPGLWQLKLRCFIVDWSDPESGYTERNPHFEVLEVKKI